MGHIMFGPAFGGVRAPRFPRLVREGEFPETACRKGYLVRRVRNGSVEPYSEDYPIPWLC